MWNALEMPNGKHMLQFDGGEDCSCRQIDQKLPELCVCGQASGGS